MHTYQPLDRHSLSGPESGCPGVQGDVCMDSGTTARIAHVPSSARLCSIFSLHVSLWKMETKSSGNVVQKGGNKTSDE
jgi:hypothetical protein